MSLQAAHLPHSKKLPQKYPCEGHGTHIHEERCLKATSEKWVHILRLLRLLEELVRLFDLRDDESGPWVRFKAILHPSVNQEPTSMLPGTMPGLGDST